MRIVSLNTSPAVTVEYHGRGVATGIFKEPRAGRLRVNRLRIEGDVQADLNFHGGLDKAVYGYPLEHYATWQAELGAAPFPLGQFGENLTTEGLLEDSLCIGDKVRAGSVLLQVSQPRQPCFKLGIRMGLPDFPRQFLASERVGFYFRVLEEGELGAGDAISIEWRDSQRVTVAEMCRLYHRNYFDDDLTVRAMAIESLIPKVRHKLRQRLNGWTEDEG